MEVKCKHCRKDLFDNERIPLMTSHGEVKRSCMDVGCGAANSESCSYLPTEMLPEWIEHAINQESWTKGRLHCPNCKNRVGLFNFVNESKCDCNKFIIPPVRITNSKVDIRFSIDISETDPISSD
ncbi:E3 ubiquitin-protein ligase RNF180-like [Ceratina calcarata]|uniref:E3 ubiquitin-protein ligase RNF180-like n=1 Tax=Ceratina calcarata TaxID=156304 RepID=A0AAJ7RWY5_9HYME|nr:E3 ubiquitin-protein ligase RNF180-like [Ceratina calcarata]